MGTKAKAARQAEILGATGRPSHGISWCSRKGPWTTSRGWPPFELSRQIGPGVPRVAPALDPAALADFSSYPLPRIDRPAPVAPREVATADNEAIRFVDVTASSGLDFAYVNGDDPETPGRRMFEFTGGGVAVLDYDLDGWPDLYFTQGHPLAAVAKDSRSAATSSIGIWATDDCRM